jgi:hypothetical protein
MSDYTVIADVGETLVDLLKDNMQNLITPASIILSSPEETEAQDNPRLSLFLYQIVNNAYLKNQDMQAGNSTTMKYPPLTLDLYYMLTSYGSSQITDRTDRTVEEHKVLGRAMQILHDNAILKGSVLRGALAGTSEELRLTLHPVPLEELNRLWNSFPDKPYKLSACYMVTPVKIDATRRAEVSRVLERDSNYYQIKKVSTP